MAEESLEPGASPKTSPASTSGRASATEAATSPDGSPNTPSKKNKRKSSEPRRRSDVGAKRFRPDSDFVREEDQQEVDVRGVREFPPDTPETVISSRSTPTPDPDDRITSRSRSSSSSSTPVPPEIGWYTIPIHGPRVTMPAAKKGSAPGKGKNYVTAVDKAQGVQMRSVLTQPPLPPVVLPPPPVHMAPGLMAAPPPRPSPTSSHGGFPHPEDEDDDNDSPTYLDPITGRPTKRSRKNYKNMTRERRVEANARERSRVHTISAAFESLRRAVPSYSYNQKLSKLAILRIACSYIMALSKLANVDICEKANSFSFVDCVDLCTQTIQTEGRARRRH